jgi:hypothetical protein
MRRAPWSRRLPRRARQGGTRAVRRDAGPEHGVVDGDGAEVRDAGPEHGVVEGFTF